MSQIPRCLQSLLFKTADATIFLGNAGWPKGGAYGKNGRDWHPKFFEND